MGVRNVNVNRVQPQHVFTVVIKGSQFQSLPLSPSALLYQNPTLRVNCSHEEFMAFHSSASHTLTVRQNIYFIFIQDHPANSKMCTTDVPTKKKKRKRNSHLLHYWMHLKIRQRRMFSAALYLHLSTAKAVKP